MPPGPSRQFLCTIISDIPAKIGWLASPGQLFLDLRTAHKDEKKLVAQASSLCSLNFSKLTRVSASFGLKATPALLKTGRPPAI